MTRQSSFSTDVFQIRFGPSGESRSRSAIGYGRQKGNRSTNRKHLRPVRKESGTGDLRTANRRLPRMPEASELTFGNSSRHYWIPYLERRG